MRLVVVRGLSRLILAVVALSLAVANLQAQQTVPAKEQLVMLNWSEYIDPELLAEFEAETGIAVKEVYFENDEDRDSVLVRTDGEGYDLAIVDGTTLKLYHQRGWLAPLDSERIPNLRHIDPRWLSAHEGAEGYAVPYFWGTMGIGYRADLVPEPITSWRQLLDPAPELRGRLGMVKDSRDLVGAGLMALGYSPNTSDSSAIASAEKLLLQQKPHVKTYIYLSLSEDSALVSGEVVAALMYNGDVLMVQEHHDEITYAVPKEGAVLWVDYLAVLAGSTKKPQAMAFIDFLNRPENAARLAEYVYYPTPNRAAEALLPEEFLSDPVIYPDESVIARSEFYRQLPASVMRQYITTLSNVVR